jgi:putative Holliday junction resolvase
VKRLGIDYGTSRIGLAITDPLGLSCRPYDILDTGSNDEKLDQIAQICDEEHIQSIVMGLALPKSGEETELVKKIRHFASELEQMTEIPVEFCDEGLSSWEAKRRVEQRYPSPRKRKKFLEKGIDHVAAMLILETFLRQASENRPGAKAKDEKNHDKK